LEDGLRVEGESLDAYDTAVIAAQSVGVAAATNRVAALIIRIVDIRPNVL
jgi:hypothetical protein